MQLRRMCILLQLDIMFCICPFDLKYMFKSKVFLLNFCLDDQPIVEGRILKSLALFFFFFLIVFIYLAVSDLSCNTQDPLCFIMWNLLLRHMDSLVVALELQYLQHAGPLLWWAARELTDSEVVACQLSCSAACEILITLLGIEPLSPAWQGEFLTTRPPGKFYEILCYWVVVSAFRLVNIWCRHFHATMFNAYTLAIVIVPWLTFFHHYVMNFFVFCGVFHLTFVLSEAIQYFFFSFFLAIQYLCWLSVFHLMEYLYVAFIFSSVCP